MSGETSGVMERGEIFAACTRMRRDTADWLESLAPDQLDAASLCAGWAVRGVAGHLIASVCVSLPRLLWSTVRHGLSPHRANVSLGNQLGDRSGAELAADLRAHAATELDVPFVGIHGPFTDLVVHNADMRVPLDSPWRPEPAWSAQALVFVGNGGSGGFSTRSRLAGLRICATDADVRLGRGAEVRGASYDLLLALCGRRVGLAGLEGAGRDLLAERI